MSAGGLILYNHDTMARMHHANMNDISDLTVGKYLPPYIWIKVD